MKKIITLCLLLVANFSFGQDTTSWRMVGLSSGSGEIVFHNSDSTNLTTVSHGFGSGHAIFINPVDDLAYMFVDAGSGDRNLYQVNPFDGTSVLTHDFTQDYIHTADIGNDGVLYCLVGNGAANAGELVTLDLNTLNEVNTGFFTTATGSRAMEFHPGDSSLYIFEGDSDMLYVVDLATNAETSLTTTGMNDELHGAFYVEEEDIFHLSAYGGEMYVTDNSYLNGTQYSNTDTYMDLSYIKTISAASDIFGYCPNTSTDSLMIRLLYDVQNFSWYKDSVELTTTNDTIYASSPGTYRALMEIGTTGNYMWSRAIIVEEYTVPNVNITQADNDTLICPNETIVLTGVNGQDLQWYLNGAAINGATSNSYPATSAGSYNLLKTNTNGCSDSSAVAYVIYEDSDCSSAELDENLDAKIQVYPNPVTNKLIVSANSKINKVTVLDLSGQVIMSNSDIQNKNTEISFSNVTNGSYIVVVETSSGVSFKKILK
ncbi:MAG: T9SS type A sorting domain-containing protein [Brumimicrobium sp.]